MDTGMGTIAGEGEGEEGGGRRFPAKWETQATSLQSWDSFDKDIMVFS